MKKNLFVQFISYSLLPPNTKRKMTTTAVVSTSEPNKLIINVWYAIMLPARRTPLSAYPLVAKTPVRKNATSGHALPPSSNGSLDAPLAQSAGGMAAKMKNKIEKRLYQLRPSGTPGHWMAQARTCMYMEKEKSTGLSRKTTKTFQRLIRSTIFLHQAGTS